VGRPEPQTSNKTLKLKPVTSTSSVTETRTLNPNPTLSIIMPVFNAGQFIKESVQSLVNQSFADFELIIVDDGCTDQSMEIVSDFSDRRIKILANDQNRGIVFSRNRGIEAASGRYIAPFDSDDIAKHDKFEKQIGFLEKNPGFGMIGSWVTLIDEQGKPTGDKWKVNAPPERIPALLLFRNYFAQSSMVIRREVILDGNYTIGYDVVEDYKMWIDITRQHKAWNYPDYLLYYRIHSKSITSREQEKMDGRDTMIFEYVYSKLDIDLTSKQKALLSALKNNRPFKGSGHFKELEEFLLHLLAQNTRLRVYDQKELMKVIYNRFLKACYKADQSGFSKINTFVASALHKQYIRHLLL
jgi:glycosyltransferase involved in cell wall biosynthesis